MAFGTKLNIIDAKFFQCVLGNLDLSGSTSVGTAQYLEDKSGSYTLRSIPDVAYVTGQTADLKSQIDYISGVTDQNSSDIVYLSGQTDLKLNITDFDTYTGDTQTTLTGLRTDIDTVSGKTDYITGLAITGATNGLNKSGQDVELGGTLTDDTIIDANGTYNLIFGGAGGAGLGAFLVRSTNITFSGYTNIQSFDINNALGAGSAINDIEDVAAGLTSNDSAVATSAAIKAYVDTSTGGIGADNGLSKCGDNIVLGGTLTGATDIDINGNALTFTTDPIAYSGDYSGAYVARSIPDAEYVTGLTDGLQSQIDQNASDIVYLSGQTDLKLNITDFNAYSGTTDTRLEGIETDLDTVSGQTDTNTSDISNLGAISGITNVSITGVTNGLTKVGSHDACLGGSLSAPVALDINSQSFTITDTGGPGLEYAADYSGTFNDCSLVSKEYVDASTGAIAADNGLTKEGSTIILGGALTGNTTISGVSGLTISAPFVGSDVQSFTFNNAPTVTETEGMLYYSGHSLNFVSEIAGVKGRLGEDLVIRATNETGVAMNKGDVVYISGAQGGVPKVVLASASDFTGARSVGILMNNIVDSAEGYIMIAGNVNGIPTNTFSIGDAIWVSTTAGDYTNVRPTYPDSSTLLGIVIIVGASDGAILVRTNNIPDHVDIATFTGYTASTKTELDLKLYISDFDTYTGDTDTRLDNIEIVTDIALTGATNGLCVTGRDVYLGGSLTEATTINGAYNLIIAPTCDITIRGTANDVNIDGQSNSLVALKSQSGVLTTASSFVNAVGFLLDYQNNFKVVDNRSGAQQTGIQYNDDYSSCYVDRSLVDKAYVDSIASGRATKASVLVGTTANITLSGLTTVDGVTLSNGNRVLVKDQTDQTTNGIYVATGTTWSRAEDYDFSPSGEIANGDLIPIVSGSTNANSQWVLTTPDIVVSGDNLTFSLFSKLLEIEGGEGICLSSNAGKQVINVDLVNSGSALSFTANELTVDGSIAGSGLTWTGGVLSVNASTTPASGNEIAVRFGTANCLYVDQSDFSYTTASNSLTKVDSNVTLGGNLTGDTTICGNSNVYDLNLTELDSFNLEFDAISTITDSGTNGGLRYAGDYSGNYVDRSIPDVYFVNNAITGSTLTYNNGITKAADVISWGGVLTGDTFVSLGSGRICMEDTHTVTLKSDCSCTIVQPTSIDNYTCNGSCISQVDLNNDGTISIVANNATQGLTITSAAHGAVYAGDYEGSFVDRSLVTKKYVDDAAGGISAANGLTRVDDNITLGGTLTGNTTIALSANSLSFIDTHFDTCFGDQNFHIDYDDAGGNCSRIYGGTSGLGGIVTLCASDAIYLYYDSQLILDNNGGSNTIWAKYNTYFTPSSVASNDIPNVGYVTGQTADLQSQIDYVSGVTDTNTSDISNLGALSGITEVSITGVTNGLTKVPNHDAELGGTLSKLTSINANGNIFSICDNTINTVKLVVSSGGVAMQDVNGGLCGATVSLSQTLTRVAYVSGVTDSTELRIEDSTGMIILDELWSRGVDYAACYHTNYTNRTLVDKEYVDLCAGGSGIQSANNGLTKSGTHLVLGGALTGDTTISGAHTLALSSLTAFNATATNIGLTGAVCVTGAVDMSSTLIVAGATTLSSTLDVTGAIDGNSTLDILGATTLHSTLTVTGATVISGVTSLGSVATGSVSTDGVMLITPGGEVKQIAASTLGEDNNRYEVTGVSNSTINLTGGEYVVFVDPTAAAVTVNLPAAPTNGMAFKIKDSAGQALTHNITIDPASTETIDGALTAVINTDYGALEIVYSGIEWMILSFVN